MNYILIILDLKNNKNVYAYGYRNTGMYSTKNITFNVIKYDTNLNKLLKYKNMEIWT